MYLRELPSTLCPDLYRLQKLTLLNHIRYSLSELVRLLFLSILTSFSKKEVQYPYIRLYIRSFPYGSFGI